MLFRSPSRGSVVTGNLLFSLHFIFSYDYYSELGLELTIGRQQRLWHLDGAPLQEPGQGAGGGSRGDPLRRHEVLGDEEVR